MTTKGEANAAGKPGPPATIDEYIAGFPPEVRAVLQRIRETVREAAPGATETISYRIPAFRLGRVLVYFAAFKHHIGFFPPVRGDAKLERAVAPYAGEKGNLRFPLDQPIPYALVARITRHRAAQERASVADKVRSKPARKSSGATRAKR